jgi:2-polyprenyl-6-hydroxyphenyl methylase/3-demethylubiquinone-9 3-methyltransferase
MNYYADEIDKFNQQANSWWDLDNGPFRSLHQINPIRMNFILDNVNLLGKTALDLGCGGGILTESLYVQGAEVTGIDLAQNCIEIAKQHADKQNYKINYECAEISTKVDQYANKFDVVTCMEMLEHVPDVQYIINHIAKIVKEDGIVFFSTFNRTKFSYLLAIVAAEYLLNMLPKGTHDHSKFVKPSELSTMLRRANLEIVNIAGLKYNPISKSFALSSSVHVSYMVACRKIIYKKK